jgi:hypothetical protein
VKHFLALKGRVEAPVAGCERPRPACTPVGIEERRQVRGTCVGPPRVGDKSGAEPRDRTGRQGVFEEKRQVERRPPCQEHCRRGAQVAVEQRRVALPADVRQVKGSLA